MSKSSTNLILVSTLIVLAIVGLALGSFTDPLVRGVQDQVRFLSPQNQEAYLATYPRVYQHPEIGFAIATHRDIDVMPRHSINAFEEPLVMFARSIGEGPNDVEILAWIEILSNPTRILDDLMVDTSEVSILPQSIDDFPTMDIFTNNDGSYRMFAITQGDVLYRLQSLVDENGLTYIDPFSLELPSDSMETTSEVIN
ncbi:MAG: hypothetical protein ACI83D_000232 [Planctomycetota bacterium]|jgi:hypothetical protein